MAFVPAHTVVTASGATPTRTAFVLHGILGNQRNWRTMARRLADLRPDFRWVLVDHRNHGQSQGAPPPHDLAACAADLHRLAEQVGEPELVIGHSFGGKVALAYAAPHPPGLHTVWVLDAQPGAHAAEDDNEVLQVISALRALAMPVADRDEVVQHLARRGFSPGLVQWMTTNLRRQGDGFTWAFELDAVSEMIRDYFTQDYWPLLEDTGGIDIHVLRAERSDRWSDEVLARFQHASPDVHLHLLPDAGHWVHVDNPNGVLDAITASLT